MVGVEALRAARDLLRRETGLRCRVPERGAVRTRDADDGDARRIEPGPAERVGELDAGHRRELGEFLCGLRPFEVLAGRELQIPLQRVDQLDRQVRRLVGDAGGVGPGSRLGDGRSDEKKCSGTEHRSTTCERASHVGLSIVRPTAVDPEARREEHPAVRVFRVAYDYMVRRAECPPDSPD